MTGREPVAPSTSGAGTVAARFAQLFPDEHLILVDRAEAMGAVFDRLGPQRPATCGAYLLAYLFPALGLTQHEGHDLGAEDYLAHLAAVVIEAGEVPISDEISRRVAAGELTETDALRRWGHEWYRFPVRASGDPVASGTSPTGVARAVDLASHGRFATLPIPARLEGGQIQLTHDRWVGLLASLAARVDTWHWHAVFNYETDQLLRPNDPAYRPDSLRRPDAVERIPRDDWGVGHFTGLAGLWRMRDDAWWLLLFDTYKERGFTGYEPQPAELMRRGLIRADGRDGGLLLVVPAALAPGIAAEIARIGLRLGMWDNGSPAPEDWTWTRPG